MKLKIGPETRKFLAHHNRARTKSVWIVVTIVNDGERDLFSDVVLVTINKTKAEKLSARLNRHEKIRGFDWLGDYEKAEIFERELK